MHHLGRPAGRLASVETLKARLQQMPRGEWLFWNVRGIPGLALPPEAVIADVRALCSRAGLQLTVITAGP